MNDNDYVSSTGKLQDETKASTITLPFEEVIDLWQDALGDWEGECRICSCEVGYLVVVRSDRNHAWKEVIKHLMDYHNMTEMGTGNG